MKINEIAPTDNALYSTDQLRFMKLLNNYFVRTRTSKGIYFLIPQLFMGAAPIRGWLI